MLKHGYLVIALSLAEVVAVIEEWQEDYNSERPHDSLGQVPPRSSLLRPNKVRESSLEMST